MKNLKENIVNFKKGKIQIKDNKNLNKIKLIIKVVGLQVI